MKCSRISIIRMSILVSSLLFGSLAALSVQAASEEVPYLQKITDPDYPIYASYDYESEFQGTVKVEGTYTIVEEAEADDGDIWGRLKSGAGWINLTDLEKKKTYPVSADFIEEHLLKEKEEDTYHSFLAEESEYTSWIFFETEETVKDVTVELLEYDFEGECLQIAEVLYSLPELNEDKPLAAGVVYWGDMTTYGISFVDREEKEHHYALYMSGKDGSLIIEEY